jgi:hypothetical protein
MIKNKYDPLGMLLSNLVEKNDQFSKLNLVFDAAPSALIE